MKMAGIAVVTEAGLLFDPDTVIVSATNGPGSAYWPRSAKAYVYRKTGLKRWEQAMSGLPEAKGKFCVHVQRSDFIHVAPGVETLARHAILTVPSDCGAARLAWAGARAT